MEGDIHTDGERNIGEGFLADMMDREFVTLSKLPPEVRKQLRVKFDNRSENMVIRNRLIFAETPAPPSISL